ncbi:MAG: hypothetical protein Q9157_002009 [Trypethelium eluteriae]
MEGAMEEAMEGRTRLCEIYTAFYNSYHIDKIRGAGGAGGVGGVGAAEAKEVLECGGPCQNRTFLGLKQRVVSASATLVAVALR